MESAIVEPAILYLKLDSIVNENPNTLHQAMRNVERSGSQIQDMQNHQYELFWSPYEWCHAQLVFPEALRLQAKGKSVGLYHIAIAKRATWIDFSSSSISDNIRELAMATGFQRAFQAGLFGKSVKFI